MAALSEILAAAKLAANTALKPTNVLEVQVTPDVGVEGDDVLRFTVVVPDGEFDAIDGDRLLEAVLEIGRSLERLGDNRFAVVSYITPAEMKTLGDYQS